MVRVFAFLLCPLGFVCALWALRMLATAFRLRIGPAAPDIGRTRFSERHVPSVSGDILRLYSIVMFANNFPGLDAPMEPPKPSVVHLMHQPPPTLPISGTAARANHESPPTVLAFISLRIEVTESQASIVTPKNSYCYYTKINASQKTTAKCSRAYTLEAGSRTSQMAIPVPHGVVAMSQRTLMAATFAGTVART